MSYKADDRCRKCGPVGNGASRGFGRYNEPGYFDDYGNFHPDPEPEPDPPPKKRERPRVIDEPPVPSQPARKPVQPEPEPGMGGAAILLGALTGIILARKERGSRPRPAPAPVPPPRPKADGNLGEALLGLLLLAYLIGGGVLAVRALFGGPWLHFFIYLGLGVLVFLLLCCLTALKNRKSRKNKSCVPKGWNLVD